MNVIIRKKDYSFLSGLLAFLLVLSLFGSNVVLASAAEFDDLSAREDNYGEDESARDDNYGDDGVTDDNYYDEDDNVTGDNYYDEDDNVTGDVYYDDGLDDNCFLDDKGDIWCVGGGIAGEGSDIWENKDPVTGLVHKEYSIGGKGVIDLLDKDKNLTLDKVGNLHITNTAFEYINKEINLTTVQGTNVRIPISVFKSLGHDAGFSLVMEDDQTDEQKKSLSEVISFYPHSDITKKFAEPVVVTFKIDPSKVKNWDDLALRYFGEENIDYRDQFVSINKETGEIVVNIYHFSSYGIVEDAGDGNNDLSAFFVETNLSNPSKDADTNAKDEYGRLPNTATNSFNFLLIGGLLLLVGAIPLARRRKVQI